MLKRILKITAMVTLLLVVAIAAFIYPQLNVITGYAAKKACSYHYIAGRSLTQTQAIDLAPQPLSFTQLSLNESAKTVTACLWGMQKQTAQYSPNIGCRLIIGDNNYEIPSLNLNPPALPDSSPNALPQALPMAQPARYNQLKLNEALSIAFDSEGAWVKQSLAMVVLHKDSIIAERYHRGYDKNTEILGWSMTKSMTNLLIGVLIKEGKITLEETHLYPEWDNDERKNISIKDLLHMSSGLEWTEEYTTVCDITRGLFQEEDFVKFAISKPLEDPIGKVSEYASGTTNILSGIIRRTFSDHQSYLEFPHKALFSKLGITSAQVETDEAGNYILSSYMYATPRDWAKLGLLYLNEGSWNGEQLVDSSYIKWSQVPCAASPSYGAHIWLNTSAIKYPKIPEDLYYFSGYEGQYVMIIPSEELIVVRLGLSKGPPFDMEQVVAKIMTSLHGFD